MNPDDEENNPFSVAELWRPSTLYKEIDLALDVLTLPPVDFEASFNDDNPYVPFTTSGSPLQLPDLDSLDFDPLPDLISSTSSVISFDTGRQPTQEKEHDIWEATLELPSVDSVIQLFTWDASAQPEDAGLRSLFSSEARPKAEHEESGLDVRQQGHSNGIASATHSDPLIKCLFLLGIGRSSLLFTFNEHRQDVTQPIRDGRISGSSLVASRDALRFFQECGTSIRGLRDFVDRTLSSNGVLPVRLALARAVSIILAAQGTHLDSAFSSATGIPELHNVFARPRQLVALLKDIVLASEKEMSNEGIVSGLYERLLQSEQQSHWTHDISFLLLSRTSQPLLDSWAQWTGLGVEGSEIADNVETSDILERGLKKDDIPTFVSNEDREMIVEIEKSLRLIRAHDPHHPLSSPQSVTFPIPAFKWRLSSLDANAAAANADTYETMMVDLIHEHLHRIPKSSIYDSAQITANSEGTKELEWPLADLGRDINKIVAPPSATGSYLPNELYDMVMAKLRAAEESHIDQKLDMTISLAPSSSFSPILKAQSRIVNATMLRLFLRQHHLRDHLNLLHSFYLFGSGAFVSRISSALFDSELEPADRGGEEIRPDAVKLLPQGARNNWPSSSSELRLELMSALAESYASCYPRSLRKTKRVKTEALPGDLSFAIRTLSDAHAERYLDNDSLDALDFLKLTYNPPAPLGVVITPITLEKYDQIFSFLLSLVRMSWLVSQLPRDVMDVDMLRLRMQIHHFVSCVVRYFFDTAINETWNRFESYLNNLETQLHEEDERSELGTIANDSLETLRRKHEQCLDRVLQILLLHDRHRHLKKLLDDMFEIILNFSKATRDLSLRTGETEYYQVHDLCATFSDNMGVFFNGCREMRADSGHRIDKGASAREFSENTMDRLLVTLEMNGFFARSSKEDKSSENMSDFWIA